MWRGSRQALWTPGRQDWRGGWRRGRPRGGGGVPPGGQTRQEGKSVGYAGGAPVSGFPTMSGPVTAAL